MYTYNGYVSNYHDSYTHTQLHGHAMSELQIYKKC